jgi:hypothetical protein
VALLSSVWANSAGEITRAVGAWEREREGEGVGGRMRPFWRRKTRSSANLRVRLRFSEIAGGKDTRPRPGTKRCNSQVVGVRVSTCALGLLACVRACVRARDFRYLFLYLRPAY